MEMEVKTWVCLCVLLRCILLSSSYSRGKLLFSNLTSIIEYDGNTRNMAVLIEHGTNAVFSLDYDYKNRYVYFPRYNIHDIVRFSYPSKNRTIQIVVQTENLPVGIGVDSANHHIYWVIQFGNKLSRCNLDGTNVTVLPTLSEPWVIRLDVSKRWMYIVEENLGISKSKFDLGENQTIVNFVSTPVRCLDIDYDENRLYWINYNGDIKSAKDDGSDVQTIISTNVRRIYYAIGVSDRNIYYTISNHLLIVTKTPGLKPTVLYNGTSLITSIFVFNQSGM
ncbi:low-density lipoprotein receptor-related protein 6-like [Mytilus edulis]|uniref:low-density lipoprotein receptor-related protein 6-like n=1 Tax=Mytilus edulis TaxID=6550 RepID=UPI0039EF8281